MTISAYKALLTQFGGAIAGNRIVFPNAAAKVAFQAGLRGAK